MSTRKENILAVETRGLTKLYKDKAAVRDLNLKVGEGQIYGFIGRNGAGKSTTLKMISGLASPTQGEVFLFGKPVSDPVIRRRLGVLIEAAGLYPNMSARQNVLMKAKCMGAYGGKKHRPGAGTDRAFGYRKKAGKAFFHGDEAAVGGCAGPAG